MDNYGFRQFYQLQLLELKLCNFNKNWIRDYNQEVLEKQEFARLEKNYMSNVLMN